MNYDRHITILSILYLASGALVLAAAGGVSLILLGSGFAANGDNGFSANEILLTWGLAAGVGLLMLLLAVPALIGGWGLMRRKSWSRMLVLVLGFLHLLSFPLGTALGVYTIWLLMQEKADAYFSKTSEDLLSAPSEDSMTESAL